MEKELDDYAAQFVNWAEELPKIQAHRQHVKKCVVAAARNACRFFLFCPLLPQNNHPLWPLDSVDIDFKKAMTPKDRISPKAGRTHAPGKSYRPLERFLPPLRPRPKQALDKQMRDLRKSKDAGKNTTGPSAPAPSTSTSQPAPSRSRSALEVELDKYVAIEVENGVIIEDQHGVPLIVLVRHTIPQDKQKEMNVRSLF